MSASRRRLSLLRRWSREHKGSAAVEFAVLAPVMLALYLGGFEIVQMISAFRKVTLTTHAAADLTSQYQIMYAADVANVLGASAQVMAPFPSANLTIVLSEIQIVALGTGIVVWSKASNGVPLLIGTPVSVPSNVTVLGGSVILAQVSYLYTPMIGGRYVAPATLSDQMYMVPRKTLSIVYIGL